MAGILDASREAIASIESRGSGDYGAKGPPTRRGDRAYGRYQVMGANVGPWTQAATGTAMTPEQFLADKNAQDQVFNHRFGGYINQYGSPQQAASVWFTGRPQAQGGQSSDGYITGNQYVDRFNKALGNPQQMAAASPTETRPATVGAGPMKTATPPSTGGVLNTMSPNNPLAGMTDAQPQGSAPLHSDPGIDAALMQAFRPVIPDQINSLLGPAIGQIQSRTNPIAFYQPRQPSKV